MKKRGFTLIEVLAVIVVLAVIALITTPIIINVIEKAKKGALEDSAYGLLDSANIYYSQGILDETNAKTEFTFKDGMQTSENKLSYKGKVENGSVRLYSDGKTALCITGGEYAALKNVNDKKVSVTRGRCSYNSETEEYETRGLCQDLQDEIDALKKKHQEELDKLKEEYEEKLKQAGADKEQLIKDYEDKIKTITDAYEAQIKELQDQLNVFKNGGTATADQILAGKTAFVKGQLITGTMVNRNPVSPTTNVELGSNNDLRFRFEPGYYANENFNGSIYKPYIYASQSQVSSAIGLNASKIAKNQTVMGIAGTYTSDANANAAGILAGQTAYVNGNKITGTMVNRGAVNGSITTGKGSYTIPAGYHNGSGKITVDASAIAAAISNKGVATDANASFQTMANNITTMANNQYNNGYNTGKAEGSTATKGPYSFTFWGSGGNGSSSHGGRVNLYGVKKVVVTGCGARNDYGRNVTFSSNFGFSYSDSSKNISKSFSNTYDTSNLEYITLSISGNYGNDSSMSLQLYY